MVQSTNTEFTSVRILLHMNNYNHVSLKIAGLGWLHRVIPLHRMQYQAHQMYWGEPQMGTAIYLMQLMQNRQVAGLIRAVVCLHNFQCFTTCFSDH